MNKIIRKRSKLINAFRILLLIFSLSSCRKLVDSPPPTNVIADKNVFSVDATAIAAFNGIYSSMNSQPIQGAMGISLLAGLSADEFVSYPSAGTYYYYYTNSLSPNLNNTTFAVGAENWGPLYNNIFKCNAAIEELTASKSEQLTSPIKRQLLGEGKFLRAFFYFYLVNLFGDVPLCLTTDPQVNTLLGRTPKAQVYQQIITDLKEAEELLSNDYLDGTLLRVTTERVRPTKWAAAALLSRVYLYTNNDWAKAEAAAASIIDNTTLFGPLPSLNNTFLKNSREAIWQLQPTSTNFNTQEAQTLVLLPPSTGPNSSSNPVYLSNNILNSFEAGDQRAISGNWINSRTIGTTTYQFPFKYKVNSSPGVTTAAGMTEYFMALRLGEQYLIRAEARAQLGNIGGAQSDLNTIRNRAGLGNTTAGDKTSLLTAILHERQVELFSEWGHRWFDLKRSGNIDAVMSVVTPLKANGAPWQSYQQLYPIAQIELDRAPNLVQNPGY